MPAVPTTAGGARDGHVRVAEMARLDDQATDQSPHEESNVSAQLDGQLHRQQRQLGQPKHGWVHPGIPVPTHLMIFLHDVGNTTRPTSPVAITSSHDARNRHDATANGRSCARS